MNEPGWQDPIMVSLGSLVFALAWLLPSTFGDPMAGNTIAWALLLTGLATGVIAVAGIVLPGQWEAFVECVLGIWLTTLPWVIEPVTDPSTGAWAAFVIGGIMVVLSGISVIQDTGVARDGSKTMTLHTSRTTEALLSAAGQLTEGNEMMGVKVLPKSEWTAYFSRLHKAVDGKEIKIEVLGATIGDQVLVRSAPLLGATYEPKEDALEISVKGMTHVVDHPQKISIQDDDGKVFAIEVIDAGDRHQLMTFA